jgi:hypothetical protein
MSYFNNKTLQRPIKPEAIELNSIANVGPSSEKRHQTTDDSVNRTEIAITQQVDNSKKMAKSTTDDQLCQESVLTEVKNVYNYDSEILVIYEHHTLQQCEIYRMCFVITTMIVAFISCLVLLSSIKENHFYTYISSYLNGIT